jgi:hypothetical protein
MLNLMQTSYIYSENSLQGLRKTQAGTRTGDTHQTEQNSGHYSSNLASVNFGFKCFSPVPHTVRAELMNVACSVVHSIEGGAGSVCWGSILCTSHCSTRNGAAALSALQTRREI